MHIYTDVHSHIRWCALSSSDFQASPCCSLFSFLFFICVGRLPDLEPLLSQCFIGSPRGVFTMGAPPPPLCPPQLLVLNLQTHKHANLHALAGVRTQHSALILVINQAADRSIVNRNAFQC